MPDIAYVVSMVSKFMHELRKPHMNVVERILRYLKSAPRKGILFSNHGHLEVKGYIDVDWAGSADDIRSTSGYFTFVGGNLVTWRSFKPKVAMNLYCDNTFAIKIAHNPIQHDYTKYVEVGRHFIKEKLEAGILNSLL
ncbi:secreted RxLR effector protein 161-like [Humulus lupulus]|uniref:secreted RxLR effector protein 161-like n=1 Tax=Humulus lupulus TaxID=3486 RepID=UPI002B40EFA1|nr:secreted RxLR effector protein 161-like [Humulus lupulus]